MNVVEIARPIAQQAHDATFPVRGCLRRLDIDARHLVAGDYVQFTCPGCKAEHRVSGLQIAAASYRTPAG